MTTKPSVTKQFKESIFPIMEESGFKAITTKLYCRLIENEVIQFIAYNVSSSLRREVKLEYGSFLLSTPNVSFNMNIGGRFTKGSSAGSYGASNDKMLEKSMTRILTAYEEEVLPKLKQSETVELLVRRQQELKESAPHLFHNGHTELSIACALSLLHKEEEAKQFCHSSIINFTRLYKEESIRTWAKEGEQNAQYFLQMLESSTEEGALKKWKEESIQNLKLKKITT
jgi:hypothetical protein